MDLVHLSGGLLVKKQSLSGNLGQLILTNLGQFRANQRFSVQRFLKEAVRKTDFQTWQRRMSIRIFYYIRKQF
jgi:hypothetical protein